jgi:hypothetical protein
MIVEVNCHRRSMYTFLFIVFNIEKQIPANLDESCTKYTRGPITFIMTKFVNFIKAPSTELPK